MGQFMHQLPLPTGNTFFTSREWAHELATHVPIHVTTHVPIHVPTHVPTPTGLVLCGHQNLSVIQECTNILYNRSSSLTSGELK